MMLRAMLKTAPKGIRCHAVPAYTGTRRLLMTYGTGHPERRPLWQAHVASGGRMIGWDLGYWARKTPGDPAMRLTIDADHPQAHVAPEDGARWAAAGIALRDDYAPRGHIVLAGMGWKSRRIRTGDWEADMLARIRAAYPDRRVVYKPKRVDDPKPAGVDEIAFGTIEQALRGAALLVCRHSNVAVDACIAGVPAVCEDGIAAALYGADLAHPVRPSPARRLRFLESVAWWQYKPSEARLAWAFLARRGFLA